MNDMENKNASTTTNDGLKEIDKQILLCMDGDVQYAEGGIHLSRLALIAAIIT